MIGEILSSHAYPSAKRTEQTATARPASAAEEARLAEPEPALDRYTPTGRAQQAADYRTQILAAQHKFSFGELRERIAGLLRQQGIEAGWLTRMSSEDAAAALADDGYWGVEQTASRIVNFAIAASGNDPSKLQALKEAVLKGYEQAKSDLGGWLPDISARTLDRVMAQLDAWAESHHSQND